MDNIYVQILWVVCGVVTIGAAFWAHRDRRARLAGRAGTGILFVIGGAMVHVYNLITDVDYTDFADPAHFAWVTDTWRSVVGPNQLLFIGLLAGFEAAVGILTILGGRRTQLGYAGVIAFYLALWLFGWIETFWVIAQLPALVFLLRAELVTDRQAVPEFVEDRVPVAAIR
jgi:hypothetical protein